MIGKYIRHKRFMDVCFKVTHAIKTSSGYEVLGVYRQTSTGSFLGQSCLIEIRNEALADWNVVESFKQFQRAA